MKLAIVSAVQAFVNQAKLNYETRVIREYNRITSKCKKVSTKK